MYTFNSINTIIISSTRNGWLGTHNVWLGTLKLPTFIVLRGYAVTHMFLYVQLYPDEGGSKRHFVQWQIRYRIRHWYKKISRYFGNNSETVMETTFSLPLTYKSLLNTFQIILTFIFIQSFFDGLHFITTVFSFTGTSQLKQSKKKFTWILVTFVKLLIWQQVSCNEIRSLLALLRKRSHQQGRWC